MVGNSKIGVVVLNYNSYKLTCYLVDNLSKMKTVDHVVLVDNNSKDNFSDFVNTIINKDKVNYIKANENNGYSSGNNIGLRCLKEFGCDIAFIANPDVIVEEDSIIKITEFLSQNEEYAVASCSRSKVGGELTGQYWWIPNFTYTVLEATYLGRRYLDKKCVRLTNAVEKNSNNNEFLTVEVVGGAFFGVKLDILSKMGYLDENTFLWYEENILSFRLRELEYKVGFLRNCHYIHNHIKKGHGNPNIDIFLNSKRYYCYKYLKVNRIQKIILSIFDRIGFIEEKLICSIFR